MNLSISRTALWGLIAGSLMLSGCGNQDAPAPTTETTVSETVVTEAAESAAAMTETDGDTIKIALAGPVTGPVAQYGDMQMTGGTMAVQMINESGGIDGKMLETVVYDDGCDPKQAVAVANKIVNDGIRYVVGHLCSSSTQPASDVYEEEGVLMITPASTNPEITQQGYQMVFRTIGLDNHQGPFAADYIADTIKPTNLAIIHDKQQYGEGIATSVRDTLAERGINAVLFEGVNAGDKDFSSLIAKLKINEIDFVYYGGYHPELGMIMRQAAEQGLEARFMGPEGVGNKDIAAVAGEASEGLLVTLPPSYDQDPANASLVAAFEAADKDPSGAFVMTSYSAVQLIADAIDATGSQETEVLAEHLRNGEFNTPTGTIRFDEKGDLESFKFVIYEWHSDGSKTAVQ